MNDMPTAGGKIKVTDEVMQGFYKMLNNNNISLDTAIADLEQASEQIKKTTIIKRKKEINEVDICTITNGKMYKFKTSDGWLQIDKIVYHKMLEYFKNTKYPSIPNFFEETGIRPEKVSRIIDNEKRATNFSEEMAIEIYTFDEYFVLSNYETYQRIDENGKEDPF